MQKPTSYETLRYTQCTPAKGYNTGIDISIPWTLIAFLLRNSKAEFDVEVMAQDQDVETSSNKYHFVTAPPERCNYERLLPSECPTRGLFRYG